MMYFLDTEFIENPGSIQLISIGVVADDGRTFYAENMSFDEKKADDWVRENVISKLRWWNNRSDVNAGVYNAGTQQERYEVFGTVPLIRDALLSFFMDNPKPEFWGYFADYDWVAFCWIFGKMIDLPKHFPMYCNDIKQLMAEHNITDKVKQKSSAEHNALDDALWNKEQYALVRGIIEENGKAVSEQQFIDTHLGPYMAEWPKATKEGSC